MATTTTTMSQLTILEKMKRKIAADAPQFYDRPEQTIGRLHEIYSRFVKIKNLNKKKCVAAPCATSDELSLSLTRSWSCSCDAIAHTRQ